jgi:site-specific DNA-methyltransferase (adenine-specific)
MKNNILCGDSLEVLKDFEDNYFDSVVTDPPYGLAFMGKKWDYDVPQVELWKEVYRVLKPGGHILSFAGSRTYHRMAVNIEDAGFEIRDMLGWLYGSGFPKSHNIGKAVDKLQGNKREVVDVKDRGNGRQFADGKSGFSKGKTIYTKGNSQWEGWGTALKPAHEPIVMARKPFNTTVAENVLTHGTGGINIDECRVGTDEKIKFERKKESTTASGWKDVNRNPYEQHSQGRFPANIIHDGSEEVLEVFEESSRFFYCAKASKAERNMGLDDYEEKQVTDGTIRSNQETARTFGANSAKRKNYHPTVKPIKLMEYLVRLVTPKEGIVLEPFAGSGTTLIACKQQGFNYIGIEREQEYCDIAEARLKGVKVQGELF